jgi:hypothetical protein
MPKLKSTDCTGRFKRTGPKHIQGRDLQGVTRIDAIGENYGGVQFPLDDCYVMFSPTATRESVYAPNGPFGWTRLTPPSPSPILKVKLF